MLPHNYLALSKCNFELIRARLLHGMCRELLVDLTAFTRGELCCSLEQVCSMDCKEYYL